MAPRFALFVALTLLLAEPAAASVFTLAENPLFDRDLSGWQVAEDPMVSWDGARDVDGRSESGSAKAVWQGPVVTGLYPAFSQCVEVTPGVPYLIGGKVFIPSGQTTSGSAFVIAIPYPSSGCSGPPPPSGFVETPPVTELDRWTETRATIIPFGRSIQLSAYVAPNAGGTFQASFDDMILDPPEPQNCIPDANALCFLNSRFQVMATYDAGHGLAGLAHSVPMGHSGLFWFFASSNLEVAVKMLDGCALGGHYWFFASGLTNVEVTIRVTDIPSGAVRTYHNPSGVPFAPIQDTSAFECSP